MTSPVTDALSPEQRARARRAVVAASLGNALEWFDIIVYGFLATTIAKLFFSGPATDKGTVTGLLLTFATFALSYVIRPFGAVVIGNIGDRNGRKAALTITIGLMTLGVAIMAFAPTYATVGALAPFIILLSRLIQGFSAGGEFGSATAFLTENAANRKAFYGSWQVATQGISMLLAGAFGFALNTMISPEALESWGWRVPFIFGILIGPVGWYIRTQMDDTPEFANAEKSAAPTLEVLARHFGRILTAAACVGVATMSVYLITYLPTFAIKNLQLAPWSGFVGAFVAGCVTFVLSPFIGMLADKVGSVTVMVPTAIIGFVLAYPMFLLVVSTRSITALIAVEIVLGVLMAFYFAPLPALMSSLFPTRVRTSGMSIAYNIGVTLMGGLAPLVLAALVEYFSLMSPSYYYMLIAVISVGGLVIARKQFGER
ncbi:MAG: MFS transporter [Propionibacteriales bacterium]|nr:MFS transporter [Propionibacteriales bacterium]